VAGYIDPQRQLAALTHVSQSHRSELARRAQRQLKVLLSTLTFLILVGAAHLQNHLRFEPSWYVWPLLLVIGSLTILMLSRMDRASQINKRVAELAENELVDQYGTPAMAAYIQLIEGRYRPVGWESSWGRYEFYWFATVVIFFCVLTGVALTGMFDLPGHSAVQSSVGQVCSNVCCDSLVTSVEPGSVSR
jgi:hypothetical protein